VFTRWEELERDHQYHDEKQHETYKTNCGASSVRCNYIDGKQEAGTARKCL